MTGFRMKFNLGVRWVNLSGRVESVSDPMHCFEKNVSGYICNGGSLKNYVSQNCSVVTNWNPLILTRTYYSENIYIVIYIDILNATTFSFPSKNPAKTRHGCLRLIFLTFWTLIIQPLTNAVVLIKFAFVKKFSGR